MIIENKSKVRNSQNKSIVSQVKSSDGNSYSSSEIAKLTYAVNQQTNTVTTPMTVVLKQFQATPPRAFVKYVEEICFTYGGAHPYYQCLAADGNTFPEFQDDIQVYVSAAAVNYNQGNSSYRPPGVANQIRPSGFAQPNVQNNQNQFSQPQGYNRGNNFNEDSSYQALIQQNQVVPLSELEKIKKMNDINIKAMQTQINNVKNELRKEIKTFIQASMSNQTNELKNMMASFFQMNTATTLGSGPLPSNTIANPKEEDGRVEETLTDPELGEYTIKKLHINITLADALILIPKYQKMLKALLSNKEKPLELENTPLNENCSAVILRKLPEKLGDSEKFLIPCGFSELKCKALADLDLFAKNHLSGNPTFSSPNYLLKEFADELTLITFPPGNDDLPFDMESDLKEIEYLLNHDPTKEMDSIIEDSIDECNLADPNDNLFDTILEMFTDEHTLYYSSPPLYDDFVDDPVEFESYNDDAYNDPFESKEDKTKESKLLIDELDPPRSSNFLPSPEYDSFLFEYFSEVDALPSTDNEDKVFNLGILIHENLSEVIVQVAPDKNVKKISISHASLILKDFDPPLSDHELPFHKEVLGSETLL
uniref:Reverse transcriptase domain-containing protein n=1 Tax=Tanacetum cinerariifolium TaxID=118510 RepID=A0A699GNW8_TANCI|nr:reverse transcriptase domain-containing protein [Tanacetum cinerariifolium]